MQTPPPTSTSASRRKAQQAQVARMVKESAEKGRRMSFPVMNKIDTMETSTSHVEESPQQFSALQFSPEGFGFQSSGPATAPAYPQHKLFWDNDQGGDTMNIDFPMDDNFASFGMHKTLDSFVSNHDDGGIQFPTSPAFDLIMTTGEDIAPFASGSDADPAVRTTNSTTMVRKPSRGNGVDPSLLFSSPGRAAEASSMPSTSQKIQDDNLLPYAHQLRDAQMELEMQMSRKPKRKRAPEIDSPAVKAALQTLRDDQAGTQRDLADEDIISPGTDRSSSRSSLRRTQEKSHAGHGSLQKQRSRNRLQVAKNEVPTHKRTSVTLTIDASGRAKTETRVLADSGEAPDSDQESDSTSSSSNNDMVMSQAQSFAYPIKQKQPKVGRFTHKLHSHSQQSSYGSMPSSTSNARGPFDSTSRRSTTNLSTQSNVQDRHHRVSFNEDTRNDLESEAETIVDSEDDKGDAQSALKKLLESRQKKGNKQSFSSGSKSNHLEQRSAYPLPTAPSHPYYIGDSLTPTRNGYNQSYSNISPTTITDPDLATPSSGRSNISNDVVRCLCQSSEDDGMMIQW